MKATVVVAAISLGLIGSSWQAEAVSGGGAAEEQIFAATKDREAVTGKRWQTIRGLSLSTSCADRPAATASLSLELRGVARAVQVRLVRDGVTVVGDTPRPMAPGRVDAREGRGARALSFSFVRRTVVDGHGERIRAQVRSPSGRSFVVEKGSLIVIWDPTSGACE